MFIQMMSLTFGLFTQVSGSGPLGPLVRSFTVITLDFLKKKKVGGPNFNNLRMSLHVNKNRLLV